MDVVLREARVSNGPDPMLTITPGEPEAARATRRRLDAEVSRHGHRQVRQEVGWAASVDGLGDPERGDEGQERERDRRDTDSGGPARRPPVARHVDLDRVVRRLYGSPCTKPKEMTLRPARLSITARATILGLVLVPVIAVQLTLAGDREVVVSGRPPSGEDFDATKIRISFSRVARSLAKPVFVTHAADDSGRLFIVEQGGRIKILLNGTVLSTPFLNISAKVSPAVNKGCLGWPSIRRTRQTASST